MNPMLSISSEQYTQKLDLFEAIGFGGEMLLIGMGAIFAVLGIIWVILSMFKTFFATSNKKASPKSSATPVMPAPAPVYATQDAEIVAVIAAAIAMAESESGGNTKFRVVSFRRK